MRTRWLVGLAALALTLAACGGDDNGGGGSAGGGAAKQYKLTLIQGVKGDQFYVTMQCGAQEAAKAAGATLDVAAPDEFDASLQTPVVNAVGAKKPDAILVAPTATKLSGGKGSGLVINVKPGISTTDARAKGFEEEIKNTPGLEYIGQEYSNDKAEGAASKATAALAPHPGLVGIFGTNLFSAEGAATGLRSAGATAKVKVVGFDAGPKQVENLRQGIVQALIAQKPADIGKAGVEQAIAALKGEPVQKKIGTGFVVVTKENMKAQDLKPFLSKSSC